MHYDTRGGSIPSFTLYGEHMAPADAEFFHVEDIRTRSRLYDWAIKPHTHRGLFQVVFMAEGAGEAFLDDFTAALNSGDCVTVPPATVHAFRFRPESRGYVITCAESLLLREGVGRRLFDPLAHHPHLLSFAEVPNTAARLDGLIGHALAEFLWPQPGREQMMEWLLQGLLLILARRAAATSVAEDRGQRGQTQDLFVRFKALVEAHYQDHWPMSAYAKALNASESRLNRLCRSVAERSAHQIVQDRLLLEAKRKLTYIAAPASLISY